MGFNSAFKGLILEASHFVKRTRVRLSTYDGRSFGPSAALPVGRSAVPSLDPSRYPTHPVDHNQMKSTFLWKIRF